MKKTALLGLVLVAAMSMPLMAQTVEFNAEAPGKMLSKTNEPRFIGVADGSVVIVDRHSKKMTLERYDMAQNELARVELGSQKELDNYGGFINGSNVDLLNVRHTDGSFRVYRDRRPLSAIQQGEQTTLVEYNGNKDDKYFFSLGTSPDQTLLAGVSVSARKGLDADVRVALYNRELEEYWHKSVQSSGFNQVLVNDSGEVVLGFCTVNTKHACRFTVTDGENEENFSFRLDGEDGTPWEATMLRYGDGKLLLAVAVREENHAIMPIGTNIDRMDFYCYDVRRGDLTVTKYNFTDLDANRMANSKDDKSPRHHWVQFCEISQGIADATGAYVMLQQTWRVTKNDVPTEQHHMGMMVLRVDKEGRVQWSRPFRLTSQSSWGGRDMNNYRWRTTPNGIMLALAQNAKNVNLPDEKPIKYFKILKDKAVLSVFTLDPAGNLKRSNFDIGKQVALGSAHYMNTPGEYMLFLMGGKGRFARLTIK